MSTADRSPNAGRATFVVLLPGSRRGRPSPAALSICMRWPPSGASPSHSRSPPPRMSRSKRSARNPRDRSKISWLTAMLQRDSERSAALVGQRLDPGSRVAEGRLGAEHAATTSGSRGAREFKGSVRLPAGLVHRVLRRLSGRRLLDATKTARARANANGTVRRRAGRGFQAGGSRQRPQLAANDVERLRQSAAASTVVALRGTAGEQFQQAGFVLVEANRSRDRVEGEAREDGEFDYGWIINADTRATVWRFTWRDSAAGRRRRRRTASRKISRCCRPAAMRRSTPPTIRTILHEWNTQPPHDPDAWGLTIERQGPRRSRASVKTFAYEHVPQNATIVALTGIGNAQSKKQGFTLTRPMDVRIYALGEGRDGRMFDYGWITSAGSRKRVWDDALRRHRSRPAAIARTVSSTRRIHLDKGSYVVHYISDDSHSAEEWNAAAPAGRPALGNHACWRRNGPLDRAAVAPYDEKSDPSILAQLTEIRDDDQVRKRFTLERETRRAHLRRSAKASGGDMADYGWIEDAKTGRRVWEMTYRITEHAGGATKNRRFDGIDQAARGQLRRALRDRRIPFVRRLERRAPGRSRDVGDYGLQGQVGAVREPHQRSRFATASRRSVSSFSAVWGNSSGSTRVSPTTVMKFVSPFQRGTTCMWT